MFILKKSTAPKSDKVSMATSDSPATIAGLADGIIILNNDFNLEKPKFFQVLSDCSIDNKKSSS